MRMNTKRTFVDAAVNARDGFKKSYFFLWGQYVEYDWESDRVIDGVRSLSEWGLIRVLSS
jgi:hypothetical protein